MTTTVSYDSTTPRFGLPLLFAGQAQKETYVNEASALTDALLHCAVEGTASTPPTTPVEGTNWLVGTGATDAWSGNDGKIVCRQAGNWVFVTPKDGMIIFDRSANLFTHYAKGWQLSPSVSAPTNGTIVDVEARSAITSLISALQIAGILPG